MNTHWSNILTMLTVSYTLIGSSIPQRETRSDGDRQSSISSSATTTTSLGDSNYKSDHGNKDVEQLVSLFTHVPAHRPRPLLPMAANSLDRPLCGTYTHWKTSYRYMLVASDNLELESTRNCILVWSCLLSARDGSPSPASQEPKSTTRTSKHCNRKHYETYKHHHERIGYSL